MNKCYDKFNQPLSEGDYVDVQKDGVHQIYKKEDGELYFKPYGEEDMVSSYFSNDMVKCDEVGIWITNDRYEDIIEESKQDWICNNPQCKQIESCSKSLSKKCICPKEETKPILGVDYEFSIDDDGLVTEIPIDKQETLEEACKRIKKELDYSEFDYTSFKLGAKWQQEKDIFKEEIPTELDSVLAKITHQNDLGLSQWYEVVYYADDKWCSYNGSKTFEDGERVIEWKYCKELF